MDQFLEKHNLSKLTHKKVDAPNSPVSIKKIKSIFSNFQIQKVPSPQGSQVSFIKHLNKKWYHLVQSLSEDRRRRTTA